MPTLEDCEKLRRRHILTIGLFIAFWICAIPAVLAIEFLDLSAGTERNIIGALLGGVIIAVALQFSMRCPKCRSNLGWQVRMGVPETCRKCGARLRPEKPGDGG